MACVLRSVFALLLVGRSVAVGNSNSSQSLRANTAPDQISSHLFSVFYRHWLATLETVEQLTGQWIGLGPEARLTLQGSLLKEKYYFANLKIGSPGQHVSALLDTGSEFLSFPCEDCLDCGNQDKFARQESSTDQLVQPTIPDTCPEDLFLQESQDGVKLCTFRQTFQDGSSFDSFAMTDIMNMDGMHSSRKVMFGCHLSESAQLRSQRVAGVIGMAPTNSSRQYRGFADDLLGNFEHRAFSVSLRMKGGTLELGVPTSGSTSMLQMTTASGRYEVYPQALELDALNIPASNFGLTYVDSGTSFTYFPKAVGAQLVDRLNSHCKQPECSRINDNCWQFNNLKGSGPDFPVITLKFQTVSGKLAPQAWLARDYMLPLNEDSGLWCASFLSHDAPQTILGASWMVNKRITFSLEQGHLGIAIDPVREDTFDAMDVFATVVLTALLISCCCWCCCCRCCPCRSGRETDVQQPHNVNGTSKVYQYDRASDLAVYRKGGKPFLRGWHGSGSGVEQRYDGGSFGDYFGQPLKHGPTPGKPYSTVEMAWQPTPQAGRGWGAVAEQGDSDETWFSYFVGQSQEDAPISGRLSTQQPSLGSGSDVRRDDGDEGWFGYLFGQSQNDGPIAGDPYHTAAAAWPSTQQQSLGPGSDAWRDDGDEGWFGDCFGPSQDHSPNRSQSYGAATAKRQPIQHDSEGGWLGNCLG